MININRKGAEGELEFAKYCHGQGFLRKGSRCFVEGRLNTRSYETQDGQKRYVTEVVANFVGASLNAPVSEASNFDSFERTDSAGENIPF